PLHPACRHRTSCAEPPGARRPLVHPPVPPARTSTATGVSAPRVACEASAPRSRTGFGRRVQGVHLQRPIGRGARQQNTGFVGCRFEFLNSKRGAEFGNIDRVTCETMIDEVVRCGYSKCRAELPPPGPQGGRRRSFCKDTRWPGGKTCAQMARAERDALEALGLDAGRATFQLDADRLREHVDALRGPVADLAEALAAVRTRLDEVEGGALGAGAAANRAAAEAEAAPVEAQQARERAERDARLAREQAAQAEEEKAAAVERAAAAARQALEATEALGAARQQAQEAVAARERAEERADAAEQRAAEA